MSTSTRVRSHLRSNVVGYLALFFALTMGTAYATHPGGANTISTEDIINGEVKTADIDAAAVTSGKIAPSSVSGGKVVDESIGNVDIKAGAVRASEIAAGAVRTAEILDGEVLGADVADDSLTGDDIVESTLAFGQAQLTFANQETIIGEGARPETSEISTPALPAGAYSVTAVANYSLDFQTDVPQMACRLANSAGTGGFDEHIAFLLATGGQVLTDQSMALTLTNSIPAGGRFVLRCTHQGGNDIDLLNRKIMAVRQVSQSQAGVTPSNSG